MHRFYVPDALKQGHLLQLDEAESHHASQVLRLKSGEPVIILDGAGHEISAVTKEVKRRGVTLEKQDQRYHPPFPYQVTLFQCLPKGKAFDTIVQKATELGIFRIVPVISARTVVQIHEEATEQKVAKWKSIAIEAIKQCGSPWLPHIEAPSALSEVLRWEDKIDLRLVASLQEGSLHPSHYFREHGVRPVKSVSIWIGPEGDFTPDEMISILEHHKPVTLGPLVLRSDTAAIYCLSIINYELQRPA